MKTIKINNIEYSIEDYIDAPSLVGLNMFQLFTFIEKIELLSVEPFVYIEEDKLALMDEEKANKYKERLEDFKKKETKNSGELLQLVIDNVGELTKLVNRIVIRPKVIKPKLAVVIAFIMEPKFMESFKETFGGLTELMDAQNLPKKV